MISVSCCRLHATAVVLQAGQPLPYHGVGGFNEQALSNAVYAFEKAGLLQEDLLTAIFDVSVLRLQRCTQDSAVTFKPQVC